MRRIQPRAAIFLPIASFKSSSVFCMRLLSVSVMAISCLRSRRWHDERKCSNVSSIRLRFFFFFFSVYFVRSFVFFIRFVMDIFLAALPNTHAQHFNRGSHLVQLLNDSTLVVTSRVHLYKLLVYSRKRICAHTYTGDFEDLKWHFTIAFQDSRVEFFFFLGQLFEDVLHWWHSVPERCVEKATFRSSGMNS